MDRVALILAIALSLYALLAGLGWLRRVIGERVAARKRGMALNLARRAGPPAIGGAVLLVAGLSLGQGMAVPLAVLLIGGALAYGFHRGLAEVGQGNWRSVAMRLLLTLGLTLAVLWQTGLA